MRPDIELREVRAGSRPGDQYVRVFTTSRVARRFRRSPDGWLEATDYANRPTSAWSRLTTELRHALLGAPIATADSGHERLTKVKALAVLSSDALSSVAFATQQMLLVLVFAGTAHLGSLLPLSLAIVALLAIVTVSYRQTIRSYPNGGGSYIVARENLGEGPGLLAGASLMIDYVLNVAVSISAGVAAITSAFHGTRPYAVEMAVVAVALMVIANLRGIRESGSIFAAPTYLFLFAILGMVAVGIAQTVLDRESVFAAAPVTEPLPVAPQVYLLLILRAFAVGCTAMTGVEAIANGVPAFQPPESQNARTTLTWMAVLLGAMFLGIGLLAHHHGVVYFDEHAVAQVRAIHGPDVEVSRLREETVLSQLAQTVFHGKNGFYFFIQGATTLMLILAANTSFADFPRLASILARDGYMPRTFTFRGDRLAYSNGIIALGLVAGVLLVLFEASTEKLIPLFAVGVFVSFTLSQGGMVMHWYRGRGAGWRRSILINGAGMVVTAVVALIIGATKFLDGAWISVLLAVLLMLMFWSISRHYRRVHEELRLNDLSQPLPVPAAPPAVIVPISDLNLATVEALGYARGISPNVTAVHVTDDREAARTLRERWMHWAGQVPLDIIESPYRSFIGPLLSYLDEVQRRDPTARVTVLLPEYVPRRLWEQLLHRQTALRLKAALLFRRNTVLIDVPHHLEH